MDSRKPVKNKLVGVTVPRIKRSNAPMVGTRAIISVMVAWPDGTRPVNTTEKIAANKPTSRYQTRDPIRYVKYAVMKTNIVPTIRTATMDFQNRNTGAKNAKASGGLLSQSST